MDEIAELIGAKPNLWHVAKQDWSLALRCFFGPCLPAQFRLQGPGAWKGAPAAIRYAHTLTHTHMHTLTHVYADTCTHRHMHTTRNSRTHFSTHYLQKKITVLHKMKNKSVKYMLFSDLVLTTVWLVQREEEFGRNKEKIAPQTYF